MIKQKDITSDINWLPGNNWFVFTFFMIIIILVAHALALFSHEYAHSFTAWLLGWKTNPLALNYGELTPINILAQIQIDENVGYDPIFAGGHGWQAAMISAAGMLIGNGFIMVLP